MVSFCLIYLTQNSRGRYMPMTFVCLCPSVRNNSDNILLYCTHYFNSHDFTLLTLLFYSLTPLTHRNLFVPLKATSSLTVKVLVLASLWADRGYGHCAGRSVRQCTRFIASTHSTNKFTAANVSVQRCTSVSVGESCCSNDNDDGGADTREQCS